MSMRNTQKNTNPDDQNKEEWKAKGNRAMIINIIFFAVLFMGIILVPLYGLLTASIIVLILFVPAIIYIYKF